MLTDDDLQRHRAALSTILAHGAGLPAGRTLATAMVAIIDRMLARRAQQARRHQRASADLAHDRDRDRDATHGPLPADAPRGTLPVR